MCIHTTFQKFIVSIFFIEINTFIQQGHIKLIKIDSKIITKLQKISISNKCCFCSKYPGGGGGGCITVSTKITKQQTFFLTLIIIRNVSY